VNAGQNLKVCPSPQGCHAPLHHDVLL
jgi:hypothetical protein